jgi:hypothetical protein
LTGFVSGTIPAFTVNGNVENKNLTLAQIRYSVSGTISTNNNGSPAGAQVELRQGASPVGAPISVGTDGAYTISGLLGTYSIRVTLLGYAVYTTENFTVSGADVTKNIQLVRNSFFVSGTVSVSDSTSGGSPAGAYLELKRGNVNVSGKTATADANGAYTISGNSTGTYTVTASLDGYSPVTSDAFTVDGADVTGKDFHLEKAEAPPVFTVSGTVSVSDSASGGSPTGAHLQLKQYDGGENVPGKTATAGADGTYTISDVLAGIYTIEVSKDGYDTVTSTSVTVSNGNVTGRNVKLQKSAVQISGKTLAAALDEAKTVPAGGSAYIKLGQDESNLAAYDLGKPATPLTITIDGAKDGGGTYTVGWAENTLGGSYGDITVPSGVTLILKDVTFTGSLSSASGASLIFVQKGGTLQMEDGVTLTGNLAAQGGAVYVAGGGTFNMNGGSIKGNQMSSSGGGVYLNASASKMTMKGGEITGNRHTANGDNDVAVNASGSSKATLTMSGSALIGRIWLGAGTSSIASIALGGKFADGSDPIATIDMADMSKFTGKAILTGTSYVKNYFNRFVLGVARAVSFSSATTTPLTGEIDNTGKYTK